MNCERCAGTGEVVSNWSRYGAPSVCPDCSGTGRSRSQSELAMANAKIAELEKKLADWTKWSEDGLRGIIKIAGDADAVREAERERVLSIIEGLLLDVQDGFELDPAFEAIEKIRRGEL